MPQEDINYQEQHQALLENINQATNAHYKITARFTGGMSNFTYAVKDQKTQEQFVFRIPGIGAENFVDYHIEAKVLDAVIPLGINSTTVYLDPSQGIKIAKFIPGKNLVNQKFDQQAIVQLLKTLHESDIQFQNHYGHFERLHTYEQLCSAAKTEQYQTLKIQFKTIYDQVLSDHIHYPSHGDAQLANFILADEGKIYLLDWEFSAQNDYLYDLASYGNVNFQDALQLLEAYHSNPDKQLYVRLYGWRMFQCLQWHNVAEYKHEIGLGAQLNIPFDAVALKYLTLAEQMHQHLIHL